jgi:hypothetical protein
MALSGFEFLAFSKSGIRQRIVGSNPTLSATAPKGMMEHVAY